MNIFHDCLDFTGSLGNVLQSSIGLDCNLVLIVIINKIIFNNVKL